MIRTPPGSYGAKIAREIEQGYDSRSGASVPNPRSRPVVCCKTGRRWPSLNAASDALRVPYSTAFRSVTQGVEVKGGVTLRWEKEK